MMLPALVSLALPSLAMASCLPVEGARITAAALAGAEPAFAALAPETPLGYAPAPGTRRVLGPAELERLAARFQLTLVSSREICLERPMQQLDPERLLSAMRFDEARVEIVGFSRYPVPAGEVEFPRSGLSAPLSANPQAPVLWRGYVRYGGNQRFQIWARVRVSQTVTRVVAIETLPSGRPVEAGQVRLETYTGFPLANAPAHSLEEVIGRQPRRSIRAGAPVPPALLEKAGEVAHGDTVRVEVHSGATRLELEGRAERAGRRGETIPVRNPSSGKRFPARVEASGRVVVGPPEKKP